MPPPKNPFERVVPGESSRLEKVKALLMRQDDRFKVVIAQAPALIEAAEYGAAFNLLAKKLDKIAELEDVHQPKIQRSARFALARLWKMFTSDITDYNKKAERSEALRDSTEREVEEARKSLEKLPRFSYESLSPGAAWKQAEKQIARNQEVVGEPKKREAEHMQYVGQMYGYVLPLLRRKIEANVLQMIDGHVRLPIDGDMIRALIVGHLDIAEKLAGELVIAQMHWEEVKKHTSDNLDMKERNQNT